MSKAILVFDVDNINIDIENTQATYIELQCNNLTIQMALLNHWLKPMPEKRPTNFGCHAPLNTYVMDGTKRQYLDMYSVGWNDFIDEILGAEEFDDEENKLPIGLWYEDTDKRKPNEEMIYRKPSGEEYMWKDDMWVRIK